MSLAPTHVPITFWLFVTSPSTIKGIIFIATFGFTLISNATLILEKEWENEIPRKVIEV